MEKYGGQLIFSGKDAMGPVEVVDHPHVRNLHFGNAVIQSSMYHADPYAIEMEYNRVMMFAVVFQMSLKNVLFLGLGAGSKSKFLWKYAPECTLDVVELSPLVVEAGHRFFHVPEEDHFNIHLAEAQEFMTTARQHFYDIVFVDLYDAAGMSSIIAHPDFFRLCYEALLPGGILVWNMWTASDENLNTECLHYLGAYFDELLFLPNQESTNCVVYAFKAPVWPYTYEEIKTRAEQWEQKSKMGFTRLFDYLLPHIKLKA
jgi:spermidine synthase